MGDSSNETYNYTTGERSYFNSDSGETYNYSTGERSYYNRGSPYVNSHRVLKRSDYWYCSYGAFFILQ